MLTDTTRQTALEALKKLKEPLVATLGYPGYSPKSFMELEVRPPLRVKVAAINAAIAELEQPQPLDKSDGLETLCVLFDGRREWEAFKGALDRAIESVKQDKRYQKYGRKGATIARVNPLYYVDACGNETIATPQPAPSVPYNAILSVLELAKQFMNEHAGDGVGYANADIDSVNAWLQQQRQQEPPTP